MRINSPINIKKNQKIKNKNKILKRNRRKRRNIKKYKLKDRRSFKNN
jgi:hypothetical protein